MATSEKVRDRVSQAYGQAVSSPGTGCCGSREQKGVAVKVAGYGREELAALPEEAVVNSFGCGNPLAFAGVGEGDTVLDLGSGAGIDILLAAGKVGPTGKVIGVDMTDEMIAKARTAIEAAGAGNVEVRKGLIEDLPVETNSVDWVISNCVINLSPEKERVFGEIARVLKPGGRMRVSDIVVERLPGWLRLIPGVYNSCVGGAISEEEYVAGLQRAGLEGVQVDERIVYDRAQLAALVESEIPGGKVSRGLLRWIAGSVAGRVWSAKFSARAPAVDMQRAS